jgi:hypothetical protein
MADSSITRKCYRLAIPKGIPPSKNPAQSIHLLPDKALAETWTKQRTELSRRRQTARLTRNGTAGGD